MCMEMFNEETSMLECNVISGALPKMFDCMILVRLVIATERSECKEKDFIKN